MLYALKHDSWFKLVMCWSQAGFMQLVPADNQLITSL